MNKTSDISQRTEVKASAKLLKVGQPLMVTQRYAQVDDQPKKSGLTRKWRRYLPLTVPVAPLAEGITPEGSKLRHEDYTAKLEQYGAVIELTDVIQDTHEDPVLNTMMTRAGEQAAKVIETVTIDVLKSGTNVCYANGQTSRSAVVGTLNRGDLRKIVRQFDRTDAQKLTQIIGASANIATQPIEAGYFAMCHTDLKPDIRNITGFVAVAEYSNPGQAQQGEFGAAEEIRFVCTSMFKPWEKAGGNVATMLSGGVDPGAAAAADVYPVIIVARDAYAVVRLQGRGKVQVYVQNPDKSTKDDILAQRGAVGWKTYYACAITCEEWICRYEVTCTANPT